jgi:hypothetical protein
VLYRKFIVSLISLLAITACANTPTDNSQYVVQQARPYLPVEVSVLSDTKGTLPEYPVNSDASHYRAYLQASNNDRYRIRVSNNTDQRMGVVLAVDGRNIISGQKSYLQNTERMYILNPHSSEEYEGWRSNQNQANRFYFTQAADSYAAAWGDNSAMGVIALAVYPERPRPQVMAPMSDMARAAPGAAKNMEKHESAAGTGYGETTYSPSVTVSFEPLPDAIEKVFLKYEWRETLCKKGIKSACQNPPQPGQNRFWPDNDGYAPPPPRRRY